MTLEEVITSIDDHYEGERAELQRKIQRLLQPKKSKKKKKLNEVPAPTPDNADILPVSTGLPVKPDMGRPRKPTRVYKSLQSLPSETSGEQA